MAKYRDLPKYVDFVVVMLVVLGLDRVTKYFTRLADVGQLNYGGVFGLGEGVYWEILVGVILGFLGWYSWKIENLIERIGWFIVFTAGLSNLIDRLIYGGVWDWIYYPYFEVVGNFADVMLGVGVCFVVLPLFLERRKSSSWGKIGK